MFSNKRNNKFKSETFKDNTAFFILTLPTILQILLFAYLPMYGVILAFKRFTIDKGILGSEWIGLKNFEFFFFEGMWRVTRNTLGMNIIFIVTGIVLALIVALLMYEVKKKIHIKFYQTTALLPYFLSWVAISYIVYSFLSPEKGVVNSLLQALNLPEVSWYTEYVYWPFLLTIINNWQGVGLGAIVYYAALMGIDNELFQAAEIDGASKFRQIWHISIPQITPIIIILFILATGKIFNSDFGLFYNVTLDSGILYRVTDVIDTYVYRLLQTGNIGLSAAAAFYQSILCLLTLLTANLIVRKINSDNALF